MVKKKGEELTQQDGASSSAIMQSQRTTKGSQTAAKLERSTHNPSQTPLKGGQKNLQALSKPQSGASAVRKSQGHRQAINSCKLSFIKLSDQLKTMRQELSFVRHDQEKV